MTVPESMADRAERERVQLYQAFERLDRGEAVDFESEFADVLGVVLAPISWEKLKWALEQGTDEAMGLLGRTVPQIKDYFQHRDNVILKQHASVTDYLYSRVFGVPLAPGPDGRLVALLPADFKSELRVVWRDNDYPYYFEEGVEHHNVWANRPLSPTQLEQVISEHRAGWETLWYINPPPLMSVPAIWHAHVISRRPPAARQQQGQQEEGSLG